MQRIHKPLKSSLSYSSFDQGFELNSKAYKFHGLFLINSKEVLVNGQTYFLNQNSFIFNQELYIPLTDFLDLFSYANLNSKNNNKVN